MGDRLHTQAAAPVEQAHASRTLGDERPPVREERHLPRDLETGGDGLDARCGGSLAVDPRRNRYVYLYRTTASGMRLERRRFVHGRLVGSTSLIHGIRSGAVHDSGRIAFGPGRRLYVSTGDSGEGALAQDPRSLNGKLLALAPSQYHGRRHAVPHVVATGLRNSQGFDWQPRTGRLLATDHGPSGFDGPEGYDEVDRIVPGGNFGWPVAIGFETAGGRFLAPLRLYVAPVAPSGATFARGPPRWRGDFLFAPCAARRSSGWFSEVDALCATKRCSPAVSDDCARLSKARADASMR